MTRISFALAGAAALLLAACDSSSTEDSVNSDALNAGTDLNYGADAAATDAANAEAVALGTQEQQLEQENAAAATDPSDADEQNVAGM